MILKRFEVGPFASNCYIVGDETTRQGMVIDPGAEPETVLKGVETARLTIGTVVLTHGHIDHISALAEVKKATGARVAIHADDAPLLGRQPRHLSFGLTHEVVTPDRLLKDGDSLDVGGLKLQVIHTPGHSRGSICLLSGGVLFSGDTLFNYGIGRYDLAGGDYDQLMESLRKLLDLPGETVVYPGHGPETTIEDERRGNPFLQG